jgi:alcohol dehydrogenase class IV
MIKDFNYFAPTEIVFGWGRFEEIGDLAARYGGRALIVSGSGSPAGRALRERLRALLAKAGVESACFDGVIPNPTTEVVSAGAAAAKTFRAELVIGLGGGSSLDAAKAIAVEAVHPGRAWDYLHYTPGPTDKTLPIIAAGTTAGTGSQVTPCAVLTNTAKKDKSAIWHRNIFPKAALVDPELTVSMPRAVTAQTGFDAFCHNFEAYISVKANVLTETLALEGLRLAVEYLPRALSNGADQEARTAMSWADTLGGLVISSAGVTLPHGLGMQISGHCPWVSHGQALAVLYPAFARFTYSAAPEKFAALGRILDPGLLQESAAAAAEQCGERIGRFLRQIDLQTDFRSLGVSLEEVRAIAAKGQVLGDYKNNPRIAGPDEMRTLLESCY